MRRVVPALLSLLLCAPASAGGLFTPDTGMVGLSRGGANVANAEDIVGALYYNPAGLVQQNGFNLEGGVIGMQSLRWFQRAGGDGGEELGQFDVGPDGVRIEGSRDRAFQTTTSSPHFRPIPEAGIAFGIEDPDITIALGLYAPMAPTQAFDRYGPGRYRLVEQTLVQGNINLGFAWRPIPWFSFGAGVQLLILSLEQSFVASGDIIAARRAEISGEVGVNAEDPQWDIYTSFEASQVRPYVNVGVLFEPLPWLRVGATWSPPYDMEGTGSAQLEGTLGEEFFSEGAIANLFGDEPVYVKAEDDDITISADLPMQLKLGVRVEPLPGIFDLEVDAHFEFWNPDADIAASNVDMPLMYDDPDRDGEEQPLDEYLDTRGTDTFTMCDYISSTEGCAGLDVYRGEGGGGGVAVPAAFGTAWSLRVGGELNPVPWLGLRAGFAYESAAIPLSTQALTMMDGDKLLGSVGLEFRAGAWNGDSVFDVRATYARVEYLDREVSSDVAIARTIALSGVPTNPVDAGTYGGESHYVGLTVSAHISEMARRGPVSGSTD